MRKIRTMQRAMCLLLAALLLFSFAAMAFIH